MNLAYHYPIIYWNTSCLIVNAGADEEIEENKSTDYGEIATAISNIQNRGEVVSLPLINSAGFGFTPDEKNNRIIYSLKAINGIGDDVVRLLIENRPYVSMEDFYERMIDTKIIKTSQMIQLIKAGCFTELDCEDRVVTMKEFINRYVISPVTTLTLAQFDRLVTYDAKYHFIPDDVKQSMKHKFFKEYVLHDAFFYKNYIDPKRKLPKAGYNDRWFKLDDTSMAFFQMHYSEDSVVDVDGEYFVVSEKKFLKENAEKLKALKEWFENDEVIQTYNECLMKGAWDKYAAGSISKWEMESLSIYCNSPHELANVNKEIYDIENFFTMPDIPPVYSFYYRNVSRVVGNTVVRERKEFPKYKITRVAGTVLDKNKDKHTVTILTTDGVVAVKFSAGEFTFYDRQLSMPNEKGKNTKIEDSWFKRGNKILVCGHRQGNNFRAKKYEDTVWKHTCYLVTDIKDDGTLDVLTERTNVNEVR